MSCILRWGLFNLGVNSSVYCSSQDVRYPCVNFSQNVSLNDSVNTLFNDNSQSDLSYQDTIQYSESDSSSSSQDTIQGWTLTFSGQGPTGPLTFKI